LDLGAISGIIKQQPEDFIVEEIPLYQPSGEGTHIYALIEKTQLTTHDAIARIAAAMDVRRMDIGYAGRKDAQAITRQWISIEHIDPDKLAKWNAQIKVLQVCRHNNKLKVGHLSATSLPSMRSLSSCQSRTARQSIMES
jgi:tRNA pseudouridine13 synthase